MSSTCAFNCFWMQAGAGELLHAFAVGRWRDGNSEHMPQGATCENRCSGCCFLRWSCVLNRSGHWPTDGWGDPWDGVGQRDQSRPRPALSCDAATSPNSPACAGGSVPPAACEVRCTCQSIAASRWVTVPSVQTVPQSGRQTTARMLLTGPARGDPLDPALYWPGGLPRFVIAGCCHDTNSYSIPSSRRTLYIGNPYECPITLVPVWSIGSRPCRPQLKSLEAWGQGGVAGSGVSDGAGDMGITNESGKGWNVCCKSSPHAVGTYLSLVLWQRTSNTTQC